MKMVSRGPAIEGDGLQAVHNCFEMTAALAAEGIAFPSKRHFSASLRGRALYRDTQHLGELGSFGEI